MKTGRPPLTNRGVLWLGQTCNLRCFFCFSLSRISDPRHPEHPFMPLEKARAVCRTLREYYGNEAVAIQGGEPTVWPPAVELVRFCRGIGLKPTLITNALTLCDRGLVARFQEAGIEDFLVSAHGSADSHDRVVGMSGAFARLLQALRHMNDLGVPFRLNCVMTRETAPRLPDLAGLAESLGARAVNFLAFTPFQDQAARADRCAGSVPRYEELARFLDEALDRLEAAGIPARVRYLPFCAVAGRHRRSVYGFQQLPYDPQEWDYASWRWSGRPAQRSAAGELEPPVPLQAETAWASGTARAAPWLRTWAKGLYGRLTRLLALAQSRETVYRNHGRWLAAREGYRHEDVCVRCDARGICDGFHRDYVSIHGSPRTDPLRGGGRISDPAHYLAAGRRDAPGRRPR